MTILETERLLMRRLVASDLDDLYALYRDPEIRRHFPEGTLSLDETREELEWFLNGHPDHPELGLWATLHKPTGAFIGRCGLLPWEIEGRTEVEVAYLLGKAYWGRGLATEAARAIIEHAFATQPVDRLICMTDPGNGASRNVAVTLGMTTLWADYVDEMGPAHVYALTRPPPPVG